MELPFEVGALYHRKNQIHSLLGGQEQGGISTPKDHKVIIAFTGEPGVPHLYPDRLDDDGIFHYFGEGQKGDMRYSGGNRAIEEHVKDGKKLIIFQAMGKGRPYRYLGEHILLSSYIRDSTPDCEGRQRQAIVFRLDPVNSSHGSGSSEEENSIDEAIANADAGGTAKELVVQIRTKQRLFRNRLIGVEKGCRLTKIEDLRFLLASHIKPWADSSDEERVDGHNGLLLAPHADLLFDRGWISFRGNGELLVASNMPPAVENMLRLDLKRGRSYGAFSARQQTYMESHRDFILDKHKNLTATLSPQ